jgi:hypothetical protein
MIRGTGECRAGAGCPHHVRHERGGPCIFFIILQRKLPAIIIVHLVPLVLGPARAHAHEPLLYHALPLDNLRAAGPSGRTNPPQRDSTVYTYGKSGWFATGFHPDSQENHCTSLCGYGTIAKLAEQLKVNVPAGVDGAKAGCAMFT